MCQAREMASSEVSYERLFQDEYRWLCDVLDLAPVDLVLIPDDDLEVDPRYGGTPRRIETRYSQHDASVVRSTATSESGEPPTWSTTEAEGYLFWEEWRTTLWHEVSHQVQDECGFGWDATVENGHGSTWSAALDWMARRLGCPSGETLKRLLA